MSTRPPDSPSALRRYGRGVWVIIPALFGGFFTWLTFFILGVSARRRDWILTGGAYAVFSALAFFALGRPEVEADENANALVGLGLIVAWFGGAIHAGITYRASVAHRGGQPAIAAGWASPTSDDAGLGIGNPAADYLAGSQPVATAAQAGAPPERLVEANTARQRTLARLPGMTPELARRWVSERQRRGGFRDIDDLGSALGLQPHQIVRLRPRLSFAAPGRGPGRRGLTRRRGRVLDV